LESPEVSTPEVPRSRARRRGRLPRWLEWAIAITAFITSISSIFIAMHHGTIMQKLVRANSFPYMQGGFSDVTPDGEQEISLDLLNRGVGPAHEQSLRVTVAGKYVTSVPEMIAATMGPQHPAVDALRGMGMRNRVKTRFIPGGEGQFVFRIPRTAENAELWDAFDATQPKWDIEYCYCSVFDECWQVKGKFTEPEPIDACVRDESREFRP